IRGFPGRGAREPVEVEVLDVVPPSGNGRLALRLGAGTPASILAPAGAGATRGGAVTLVLPDRRRGRYVEYRLWDASLGLLGARAAGCDIVLNAPVIVCMTGAGR